MQTRRNAVKQTIPIARHLSYPHRNAEVLDVSGWIARSVLSADVGEGFPLAGTAGVEIGEESGRGIDFGGGVPGGVVGFSV